MSETSKLETNEELIYVGDPMCSWCWGIAPHLDELARRRPDLPMRVLLGGLRPGPNAQPMSDDLAPFLAHHWEEVSKASGQPFDHAILERRDWVYDTEPACTAVVAMRSVDDSKVWPLFKRLQSAFYAEGIVLSDRSVYPDLVEGLDVDTEAFMAVFESDAATEETWADFSLVQSWGVRGFPTLLVRTGDSLTRIASGYSTADDLEIGLTQVLSPTGAAACEPGQIC